MAKKRKNTAEDGKYSSLKSKPSPGQRSKRKIPPPEKENKPNGKTPDNN